MINLRIYQKEAIQVIHDTFKKEYRQYIEMPTGSGKTITFLSYAKQYHKKILIIVPSKELLKQVYESALLFWKSNEISRKGDRFDEDLKSVHICIINSIRGDYLEFLFRKEFDLTIIDEAHHSQANSYKRFIKARSYLYKEQDMKILGVTATPDRVDGLLLKEILYVCSFKICIEELIEKKYLSDIEGFRVNTKIDLSDIDHHNGDFSLKQLYKKLSTESRNNMLIDLVKKYMTQRKILIFCINVQHSMEICSLLRENNISASHIDGKMNSYERNVILSSFRNGEISVLCNCQLLTEGFDEPSIDGIILARPTRSKSLFKQMIGRGLRIYPGKQNCKIIDVVDNHKFLSGFNNLIEDERYPEVESFKSLKDIKDHISKEKFKVSEFTIEKVDFFNKNELFEECALDSMTDYLDANKIIYFHPISFDEASFLIWKNELKKEFKNGRN